MPPISSSPPRFARWCGYARSRSARAPSCPALFKGTFCRRHRPTPNREEGVRRRGGREKTQEKKCIGRGKKLQRRMAEKRNLKICLRVQGNKICQVKPSNHLAVQIAVIPDVSIVLCQRRQGERAVVSEVTNLSFVAFGGKQGACSLQTRGCHLPPCCRVRVSNLLSCDRFQRNNPRFFSSLTLAWCRILTFCGYLFITFFSRTKDFSTISCRINLHV